MTEFDFKCCSSRLTIEWRAWWWNQSFSCHCSRLTSDSDLLHLIALVSFMSLKQTHYRFMSFKQTSYWVTNSMTRSILVCHCSRLTSDFCLQRVAELVLFIDHFNDEINIRCALEAKLVLITFIAFNSTLCFCLSHSIKLVSISVYCVW